MGYRPVREPVLSQGSRRCEARCREQRKSHLSGIGVMTNSDANNVPEYLKRWPGLYLHEEGRIVEAPAEDVALARSYPNWPDKGPIIDGRRLTIMVRKTSFWVDEEVRIVHVVEVLEPGHQVYVMGPKPIHGEYVDGQLVTASPPPGEDPLVPPIYDGITLPSPAVDYGYDITSYRFSKPATHEIQWRLDSLGSNLLTLEIMEPR